MSFVCSFCVPVFAQFVTNEIQVVTKAPIVWNSKEQSAEFLEKFPAGSKVVNCADITLFSQQEDLVRQGRYWGTLFLVQLPTSNASTLVSTKQALLENDESVVKDVYLNVVGSSNSSTPITFSDPVFPYDMQYNAAAIAGGVKYTGWQHANGYIFYNTDRILVGVIDGGANLSHQDAVNSYYINALEIAANGIDDDMNGRIDDVNGWNFVSSNNNVADDNPIGHGTVVSSELGARNNNSKNTVGYLSDSMSVLVLKAANSSGTVTDFATASAYYYALSKHCRIVNMSFGFSSVPTSLMAAIATGVVAPYNCVPVAAVGNTGGSYTAYPASGAHVLTVGNCDNGGVRHSTSSYSTELDIMAVGVNVAGHHPTSTTLNTTLTGTSQAAPKIAGVCHKILKADSTLTVDDVIDLVRSRGLNHAFLPMTGWGPFSGLDTLMHNMMSPDTVVTFAACSGKQCLPYSKHFAPVDSLRFGLAAIAGDSINTNLLTAGTYTYKLSVKFEPRPGEFFRDTFNLKVVITGSGGSVAPTISINATPGGAVCAGTSVNFTSTITDGGASPTYVWKVNTVTVGTGSSYSYTPASGDVVYAILTSSAGCASPATVNSNTITMTVNPSVTPGVTINATPAGAICAGTLVTFNSTIANGGSTPSYQWKKNGVIVGSGTTYTDMTLATSDIITCNLTSSAVCAVPATVASNTITMTVNPVLVPGITINATPVGAICAGTSVTFSSVVVNAGSSPVYDWKVNGVSVGSGTSYSSSTLVSGDLVTCSLASSATCASPSSVTSNTITMTVNPSVTPGVTINATPAGSVCTGTSVTFTPTITGGGSTPSYQWYVNSVPVGTGTSYSSSSLVTGDLVSCTLASSAACATPSSVGSNTITMTVSSSVTPSIIVAATPGANVCTGTTVTFTATPSGGGSTPTYQWYKNSIPVGTSSVTYVDASLLSGDVISCELISSLACVTTSTAMSAAITMTVNATVTPAVAVAVSPSASICSGTSVTFSATPSAGGSSPSYQWYIGATPVATGSTFSSSTLATGDAVKVVMTSSAACASPTTATSVITIMTVTPSVAPSATINATPGTTICPGTPVSFTSSITNGGSTPTYTWKKNGVPVGSGTTYSSSALINGDVIVLTVTGSAACSVPSTVNSNTITVTVNTPVPVPSFTISGTPVLVGSGVYKGIYTATIPSGVSTYTLDWYLNGDLQASTITNSWVHDPLVSGHPDTVYAVLTPTSGCYSPDTFKSGAIVLKSPVGVAALTKENVNIYPNPVHNLLTIEGLHKGSSAVVVNVLGQVVKNYTFMNDNSEQIEFTSLMPGIYTLRIIDEEGMSELVYKLMKE